MKRQLKFYYNNRYPKKEETLDADYDTVVGIVKELIALNGTEFLLEMTNGQKIYFRYFENEELIMEILHMNKAGSIGRFLEHNEIETIIRFVFEGNLAELKDGTYEITQQDYDDHE